MHLEGPIPDVCNGGTEQGELGVQPSLTPGELQRGGWRTTSFSIWLDILCPVSSNRLAECSLHAREGFEG